MGASDRERLTRAFLLFCFLFYLLSLTSFVQSGYCDSVLIEMERVNNSIQGIFQKRNRAGNLDGRDYKCATPIIHYALNHKELLWPENLFILYRPDNPSFIRYYYPDRLLDLTYNTPEGHFKIHYTESGDDAVYNSDGNPLNVPDYVIQFGSYFENSWDHEINISGYNPPHTDGTNGGDSRLDVYIKDITYYGYTSVENGHPYIVVDNDYTFSQKNFDPEGSRNGSMKVTAAHEFFHAIQFFYDDWCDECLWWEENTAVWMEDEVFDYVDDYLRYLRDKLLNMELPLDDERFMYGGVIWAKFLSETYGKNIIRDIFERFLIDALTAKDAIEYTLNNSHYNSNWSEAMTRFCLKNLTMNYEEGANYFYYLNSNTFPEIIDHQISTTDIEAGYWELGVNIGHLSCKYFKFVANTPIENIRLSLTSPPDKISPLALFVGDENREGNPVWDTNIWPSTGTEFVLDEFGTSGTYPRAYLILINTDPDNNNCQYNLTTDISAPALQTPVIHYPVSGWVITFHYDYQPLNITLSINNLPNDPLNPDRELEYIFELYKNNNSNLVDSQIIPEDHNNPNGTTSCQIKLNDQTGGLYYWRCRARIANSNDRSFWTTLSDFYLQVLFQSDAGCFISALP